MNDSTEVRETSHPPLISGDALREIMDRRDVKIFDVRGTWKTPARALHNDYLEEHIPGAAFLDWTSDFLEQNVAVGLASVSGIEDARKSFRSLGIDKGDLVILYDDYQHMFAGRIWWALRYWGFDNVQVLDGGWSQWKDRGHPISTNVPQTQEGSFQPERRPDLRIDLSEFLDRKNSACVIDGRGAEGYAGKADDLRTGHIPGAVNIPYNAVLDKETGCFLEPDAIQSVFDNALGDWQTADIISSCGSGYAGTVLMLAFSMLGTATCLYDGSFAEWKQDAARPVEQGSGQG